jgi:uncharacterized glyoxalase superfamily protein PhnB
MLRCTPFLLFDGNCAEAMSFYHAASPFGLYGQFYDRFGVQWIFRS